MGFLLTYILSFYTHNINSQGILNVVRFFFGFLFRNRLTLNLRYRLIKSHCKVYKLHFANHGIFKRAEPAVLKFKLFIFHLIDFRHCHCHGNNDLRCSFYVKQTVELFLMISCIQRRFRQN